MIAPAFAWAVPLIVASAFIYGAEGDVIRGLYRFAERPLDGAAATVRLIGSGAILREGTKSS